MAKEGLPGGLTRPEDLFAVDFFRRNPRPFYDRAKTMLFSSAAPRPTPCHRFQRLLHSKGLLRRIYTQNIDSLEFKAGIPKSAVMQCHGGMSGAHCVGCKREVDLDELERKFLATDKLPKCRSCGQTPKPDIVFFGEGLPDDFFRCMREDFQVAGAAFKEAVKRAQSQIFFALRPLVEACLGKEDLCAAPSAEPGTSSDLLPTGPGTPIGIALVTHMDMDSWNLRLPGVRAAAEQFGKTMDLVSLLAPQYAAEHPSSAPREASQTRAAFRGDSVLDL